MKTKYIAAILVATLFLGACSTLTPQRETALLKVAGDVAGIAANYAADGQISYASAIPVAIDSLAVFHSWQKVDTATLSTSIAKTVSDFTDGSAKTTGQKIAAAITDGLPAVITGAQAVNLLSQASVQASSGVQSVVNSAP